MQPFYPPRPKFDPALPTRVGNVGLRTGGVAFAPGAAFPWRSLQFTERRVRQMVEQRQLVQDAPAPARSAEPVIPPPTPKRPDRPAQRR